MDESTSPRERVAAMRAREVEACPPELRPSLQRVHDATAQALTALTARSRVRRGIESSRAWLERCGDAARAAEVRERMAALEAELPEAEAGRDRACVAVREASQAHDEARMAWRLAKVPETRREEARALLLKERAGIQASFASTPVDGGTMGAAGGAVFRLERLLRKAREEGDEATVARLTAELGPAQERKARLEAQLRVFNEGRREVARDYERQLQAMIDG